jgi:hypothetical protein
MSKTSSDNLFELIKALKKPEKRYFKVYASRAPGGESNFYNQLFDAIDKQKEYDETLLVKQMEKLIDPKQFPISKTRLYDMVLRSLDAFHSNSSIDAQLKKLLHGAEILYKKTLYKQSAKLLKQAKKMAYEYEKHTSLLEIFKWEKLLIEKDTYEEIDDNELQRIYEEDRTILKKIELHSEFWNIKSNLFRTLNKTGSARSQEELEKFRSIIASRLEGHDEKHFYYETRYLYNHTNSAFYFSIGDYKESYKYLTANLKLIEDNLEMFSEEPNIYFSLLTNIVYIASQLKMYKEVFFYLDKLRELPKAFENARNEDLDVRMFYLLYSTELTIHFILGDFEKAIDSVPLIEAGLKLYEDKLSHVRKAFLYYNVSINYFGEGKYNEALRWINKLLDNVSIDKSQAIYCFAEILNLVIHIELGNQSLLPYQLKSTHRYLKTRNRVYKFETVMLRFINRITNAYKHELAGVFAKLREDLMELNNDPFERTAFEYFDFISWVESKVEHRAFKEIVKEKVKVAV